MSEGRACGMCGQPGGRYLLGVRCDEHQPALIAGRTPPPVPDPELTAAALRDRVLDARAARTYGHATTDPRPWKNKAAEADGERATLRAA